MIFTRAITVYQGDKLFVYTDGVPEACNKEGEFFGMGRLMESLEPVAQGTPKDVLSSVRKAVNEFADEAEQFDDLTMMCLAYEGTTEVRKED